MTRALPPIGRATRTALAGVERWTLPSTDARVVARLLQLGTSGVGGFIAGSSDEGGPADGATTPSSDAAPWLDRTPDEPTLSTWLTAHPGAIAWPDALALVLSLARAVAACERAALFPGAVEPEGLCVRGLALELRADS